MDPSTNCRDIAVRWSDLKAESDGIRTYCIFQGIGSVEGWTAISATCTEGYWERLDSNRLAPRRNRVKRRMTSDLMWSSEKEMESELNET